MEIEFNVDAILKEKGLNIRKAAALCGLSYSTAYPIVKNKQTRVDLRTLALLSAGLGVEMSALFREKKTPTAETAGA